MPVPRSIPNRGSRHRGHPDPDPCHHRGLLPKAAARRMSRPGSTGLRVERGGTPIDTFCEDWTFAVLADAFAKIAARTVSEGFQYQVRHTKVPGQDCRLTSIFELDRGASVRWIAERPNFLSYVEGEWSTPSGTYFRTPSRRHQQADASALVPAHSARDQATHPLPLRAKYRLPASTPFPRPC